MGIDISTLMQGVWTREYKADFTLGASTREAGTTCTTLGREINYDVKCEIIWSRCVGMWKRWAGLSGMDRNEKQ